MKKIFKKKKKKQKKILIIGSLSLLLFLCVGYAAFSTNISLKAKGNIKDKSRVIQAWSSTDQTDFHSDYYKENIVSATFLDNADVPSNATESWNVSEDKTHGGVMAWVIPNDEDSTKYDLYIGAQDGVIANEDSGSLFYDFRTLENINFNNNFDTSNATQMPYMFGGSSKMSFLDLSDFDTSNVTNMHGMFSAWKTTEQTWGTSNLSNIIFGENFLTSKVTNMQDMFSGTQIVSLSLNTFDTSNVTSMFHMFYLCNKLEILNICSFNTEKVSNMSGMFQKTTNLKNIYVGSSWTTTQANTSSMFTNSGISSVTTGQC